TSLPVAPSHRRTTRASPPEASVLPSGLNASALPPRPAQKRSVPRRATANGGSGPPERAVAGGSAPVAVTTSRGGLATPARRSDGSMRGPPGSGRKANRSPYGNAVHRARPEKPAQRSPVEGL